MAETVTVGLLRKQTDAITELLAGLDNEAEAPYEAYIALAMAVKLLKEEKNNLTAG